MVENRKVERKRTVLRGTIIFNNRNSTVDCLVRNFATIGAKLAVDDLIGLPEMFELHIPQKGRSFMARIVWRAGNEVGVEFRDEAANKSSGQAGDGSADRLRELERENAVLRKQVADLQQQLERYFQTV